MSSSEFVGITLLFFPNDNDYIPSWIFENVTSKYSSSSVKQFFLQSNQYKNYERKHYIFSLLLLISFSSLLLLLRPFSSVSVIFGLIGHKKPAFWPFTTRLAANFARFVFKYPDRYIYLIQKKMLWHWSYEHQCNDLLQ